MSMECKCPVTDGGDPVIRSMRCPVHKRETKECKCHCHIDHDISCVTPHDCEHCKPETNGSEEWEKEFEREFEWLDNVYSNFSAEFGETAKEEEMPRLKIKSFISQLLKKREQEVIEKLRLEKKGHEEECQHVAQDFMWCDCGSEDYNQAVDDLEKKIEEIRE